MKDSNGFVEHTLANGLRLVIEPMPQTRSVAAGFLVRTGARDEHREFAGVSHFLEHMCFKGTHKRDWRQITIDFDRMGSTYNAYTSKERTFYFGWVRDNDLDRQVELLADMMRSAIPPEEFEMEKKVILEEIAMSNDALDRHVYDLIHEKVFAGHPLAWPVLGTAESVGALTRAQMKSYFDSRYHPANMVLIVAGAINPRDAIQSAEKICSNWERNLVRPPREEPPDPPSGKAVCRIDRFQQQAVAIVHQAPSAVHPDREVADVFAAILGGHNSRFYWNIVQAGIAPHLWAGRLDYCDVGLMIMAGFCEPERAAEVHDAMRREVARVSREGVKDDEVQRVKNRTRTALATEAEAPYYRLSQMVHDIDVFDRPRSVSERLAAIDAVTAGSIADYVAAWPTTGEGYLTSVGPREWP
jgi:predicted Zn-dependent peptidase